MKPTLVERPLWPTYLFEVSNPEHEALRPGLIHLCEELAARETDEVPTGIGKDSKRGLVESRWNFLEVGAYVEVAQLRVFCESAVSQVVRHLSAKYLGNRDETRKRGKLQVLIKESWFHITRDGGSHDFHAHPNCSWSGIYYVDKGCSSLLASERNGVNRFYSPLSVNYRDAGTEYLFDTFDVVPEDGKLVVFPAYLGHSAVLYRGSRKRIVVAFNAVVDRGE